MTDTVSVFCRSRPFQRQTPHRPRITAASKRSLRGECRFRASTGVQVAPPRSAGSRSESSRVLRFAAEERARWREIVQRFVVDTWQETHRPWFNQGLCPTIFERGESIMVSPPPKAVTLSQRPLTVWLMNRVSQVKVYGFCRHRATEFSTGSEKMLCSNGLALRRHGRCSRLSRPDRSNSYNNGAMSCSRPRIS